MIGKAMRRAMTLAVLAGWAGPQAMAQMAEPAVTSLPEAVRLALGGNPSLTIQRGVEDEARSAVDSARAARRVRIDLSASAGVQNVDPSTPFSPQQGVQGLAQAQVQASLPVYTSGRLPAAIRAAQAGLEAAGSGTEQARQQVLFEAVSAYVGLLEARETVAIRENNVALAGEQRQAAQDRFDVGEITRTDVALANAREEGAKAFLEAAKAELAAAEALFAQVIGVQAGALEPLPPRPALPMNVEVALEEALVSNPAIKAAQSDLRAAEEAVTASRAALKPQISVVGRASAQELYDDRLRDSSVSILGQASVPLYDGDQIRSQARGAIARREQAAGAVELARRQVIRELTAAWSGLLAADRAILASRAQVDAAQFAYDGARQELAVGQRTTLDVLDTEQDLFDARLALVSAESDAYLAAYRIQAALGALTQERLPVLFDGAQ